MKTLLKIEMDEQHVALFFPENSTEMAGYIAKAMYDAAEENPIRKTWGICWKIFPRKTT